MRHLLKRKRRSAVKVNIEEHIQQFNLYGGQFKYRYQFVRSKLPKHKQLVQRYERHVFNDYQNLLYNQALYGLRSLPVKMVQTMSEEQKKQVMRNYQNAQKLVKQLKQNVIIDCSNAIIDYYLAQAAELTTREAMHAKFFLQGIRHSKETDTGYRDTLTFKDLGITKEQIIEILIKHRILPENYHTLKGAPKTDNHGSRNHS